VPWLDTMVLHPSRGVGCGTIDIAKVQWNGGGDVAHMVSACFFFGPARSAHFPVHCIGRAADIPRSERNDRRVQVPESFPLVRECKSGSDPDSGIPKAA